jgi:catechol 2,3-dioxygenase-like lactoylglutathione lyase family enzyme
VTVDKQPETRAVEGARQLALGVHVSELQRSITWYQAIGFELVERKETFAVLGWDDARFFIKEHPQHGSGDTNANIRVMVPDVDLQWDQVETLGLKVVVPIDDRVTVCAISPSQIPTDLASVSAPPWRTFAAAEANTERSSSLL